MTQIQFLSRVGIMAPCDACKFSFCGRFRDGDGDDDGDGDGDGDGDMVGDGDGGRFINPNIWLIARIAW